GGVPFWIGGRTVQRSLPTSDVSLYRGGGAAPVRLIGSGSGVVGGLALDARRPLHLAFLTPSGSRIYGVFGLPWTSGVSANNDEFVGWREAEVTGSLVRVLLREGAFLNGTDGERWKSFDQLVAVDKSLCPGVNEWALLAHTNADA
ncbi:MAG: hypothetical protein K2Q09_06505, partial [Phycisphaerales bacterium]|nr:hypothetical protein [Phycisphaerales bacterium]